MEHLTSLSHTRHESCRTVMYGIMIADSSVADLKSVLCKMSSSSEIVEPSQ